MHLAKDCLTGKAPLTFFREFLVEKDGRHKNRLDLKTRGLGPFCGFRPCNGIEIRCQGDQYTCEAESLG